MFSIFFFFASSSHHRQGNGPSDLKTTTKKLNRNCSVKVVLQDCSTHPGDRWSPFKFLTLPPLPAPTPPTKSHLQGQKKKAAWQKKKKKKYIQLQNKCVCIGRLPGHASWAPRRHLLTVALTRQSPAANAMWQCWDYNIWPALPGINAITAPRPLRWAAAGRGREAGIRKWAGGVEKGGHRTVKWTNEFEKMGEAARIREEAPRTVEIVLRGREKRGGEGGCFTLILCHFRRMRSRRACR